MTVSREVQAVRGITAGSAFATTEMRLAMLSPIDHALEEHLMVSPTLFVDDVACELAAREDAMLRHLSGFVLSVCRWLEDARNDISLKKSICIVSCPALGKKLEDALCGYSIKFHRRVKSLGTGLGGGARRNVQVLRKRLV